MGHLHSTIASHKSRNFISPLQEVEAINDLLDLDLPPKVRRWLHVRKHRLLNPGNKKPTNYRFIYGPGSGYLTEEQKARLEYHNQMDECFTKLNNLLDNI